MSAVLKNLLPETRGMGDLADFPLAKAYGWDAPIQDYRPLRSQTGNYGAQDLPPIRPTRAIRIINKYYAQAKRRAPREIRQPYPDDVIEKFRVAYIDMVSRAYEYGEFMHLCMKHHVDFDSMYTYVRTRDWFIPRRRCPMRQM